MDIKRRIRILPLLAVLFFAPTAAAAGAELVPVGEAVGIVLDVKGVYVEELAPFRGETGRRIGRVTSIYHKDREKGTGFFR